MMNCQIPVYRQDPIPRTGVPHWHPGGTGIASALKSTRERRQADWFVRMPPMPELRKGHGEKPTPQPIILSFDAVHCTAQGIFAGQKQIF